MSGVVVVTWEQADQPRSGGAIRSLRLMQSLAQRTTVHVVVVGPDADAGRLQAASGAASVAVFPLPDRPFRTRWWAVRRRWPLDASRRWSTAVRDHLASVLEDDTRLVIEHVHLMPYVPAGARFVLSTQNAEHALLTDRPPPGGWRRREHDREVRVLEHFERRAVQDPGATVITVSAADARQLGVAAHVVENGADLPEPMPELAPNGLLFIGSLGYPPNADAVRWWCESIWPLLPVGTPRLTVLGRGSEGLGDLREHPGVDLLGEVPDVDPHLRAARVVVVPLRFGSGTRLKVLEAMAYGRLVVSTSKGIEGLDLGPDEALVADEPAAVADAVVRLLSDDALAEAMRAAGRLRAEAHDWRLLGQRYADIVLSSPPLRPE